MPAETWTKLFVALSRAPIIAFIKWASVSKNEINHCAYIHLQKKRRKKCTNFYQQLNNYLDLLERLKVLQVQ